MTREEFAKKIHWSEFMWLVSIVNVASMLPQLWQIIQTRNVDGLSLSMFFIVLFIQVPFTFEFYFTRKKIMTLFMVMAALVSLSIISYVVYLRNFA